MPSETIVDVDVNREGSMFVFSANTDAAFEWLRANTNSEPWQRMGTSLCIDGRFAVDLANGMQAEGFVLE